MGIKRRVNAICALVISPRLYSTDFRMPLPHTKPTGPPAAPALGEHLAAIPEKHENRIADARRFPLFRPGCGSPSGRPIMFEIPPGSR